MINKDFKLWILTKICFYNFTLVTASYKDTFQMEIF